jgi:SPP1 gp7 family putative phage head morphogenesis protein
MRWARANVQPITVLERNAYHKDEAGQNARTIIQQMRYEAARLEAKAEETASAAIEREAKSHTKRWIASIKAGANIDVTNLLRDDDLVDLLAIKSEQFNGLITNLSQDILNRIERETLGSIFEGRSNADIAKSLQEIEGIGRNRARLIARDQASKLNGAMNAFRQQQAGIESYKWSTILDGRERPAHHARNGKIFRWDKPPYDGAPSVAVNCRCRALAIIPDDETGEPAPASVQEIEPTVDYKTVEPLIKRVGLTPTKNVFSWTANEIDARSQDLAKVLEAVRTLKGQADFTIPDAERLTKSVFGFMPSDKILVDLLGGKLKAFTTRRSMLFQAVSGRLEMINNLLQQARIQTSAAEVVTAPTATVVPTAAETQAAMIETIKGDKTLSRWVK